MQKSNVFNRVKTQNVLVLLTLTSCVSPCWSQSSSPDRDWIIEMWTGNDAPYRQARNSIDQRIARGESSALIAYKLRQQGGNPFDTKVQFKWAYAAYQAVRERKDTNPQQTMSNIVVALERADSAKPPHSYEYSRLRFLAMARLRPDHRLKPMGERLLKRNPKDYEVMFYQIDVLDPSVHKEDEQPSLRYARTLIKAVPKKPVVYSALGVVYYKMYLYRVIHHSADAPMVANQSIAAYNKFLQVAPPNHPFRKDVQKRIKSIRQKIIYFKEHPHR